MSGAVKGFDGRVSVMTQNRNIQEQETLRLHAKTFKAWVNAHLKKRNLRVADMEEDFRDGLMLIALVEILSGEKNTAKFNKNPVLDIQKIENCAIAIDFIKKFVRVNVGAKDLAVGNQKVLMGLIWRLILNFQLLTLNKGDETGKKVSATAQQRNAKKKLLEWCQVKTEGYDGVNVQNFDSSFQDGLAFCALVNKYDPSLLDYDSLDRSNIVDNLELAFQIAEDKMGIPQLIDPEDMVAENPESRPDEQCIITYLSDFPRAFEEKASRMADSLARAAQAEEDEERRRVQLENQKLQEELSRLQAAEEERARMAAEQAQQAEQAEAMQPAMMSTFDSTAAAMAMPVMFDPMASQMTEAELLRVQQENDALQARLAQMRNRLRVGVFHVNVVEARCLMGVKLTKRKASDPYVLATLDRQKEKTKKQRNTIDPVWNYELKFFIEHPDAVLSLEVYDWNRFLSDSFLGKIDIPVREYLDGKDYNQWFTLLPKKAGHKVSGEIHLQINYQKPDID